METILQQSGKEAHSSTVDYSSGIGTRLIMSARNLRKDFGGHSVLKGISLDLHEGEVILLRGDNGSGKTTLLNTLTGNLEPDSGSIRISANGSEENFHFPFKWWQELNPFSHFTPEKIALNAVGRSWQDIRLFKTRNLLDNIAVATPGQPGENPASLLMHPWAARKFELHNQSECKGLLAKLGLNGREYSSADKVSLGQIKRVAIARAVRAGARILFLDEPLSGLDSEGIDDTLALLASLAREEHVTMVIVEHVFNIPRILDLVHTVWTLRDGRIRVDRPCSMAGQVPSGFDSVAQKLLHHLGGNDRKVSEEHIYGGARLIKISAPCNNASSQEPILDINSLVVRRDHRLVIGKKLQDSSVQGISFSLNKGEVAILHAPNGWGKTTLLEALSGVIPKSKGQASFLGMNIFKLPPWKRARLGFSYIPSRNNLFPNLSVAEFLKLKSKYSLSTCCPNLNPKSMIGDAFLSQRQNSLHSGVACIGMSIF